MLYVYICYIYIYIYIKLWLHNYEDQHSINYFSGLIFYCKYGQLKHINDPLAPKIPKRKKQCSPNHCKSVPAP